MAHNPSAEFRALRLELGLTQRQTGAILGLSTRQVRNLEGGRSQVKALHLLAMQGFLAGRDQHRGK